MNEKGCYYPNYNLPLGARLMYIVEVESFNQNITYCLNNGYIVEVDKNH